MSEMRRSSTHTTLEQIEALVSFLEDNNKALLCLMGDSSGRRASVQGSVLFSEKKHVYEAMARVINRKFRFADIKQKWTHEMAKGRWERDRQR
jgi:hypothetical protein